MGKKTKIDWCNSTWNPVTGCLHGCAYCYARRIAERFRAKEFSGAYTVNEEENVPRTTYELEEPVKRCCTDAKGLHVYEKAPYPFGFVPTFHRYRLDDPKHWTKPKNIFVCSMADLFGEWVPDEWIKEVLKACEAVPWHRYLFLTKNGKRYRELYEKGIMPMGMHAWNKWFGCTVERETDDFFFNNLYGNGIDHQGFLSIEPMLSDFEPGVIDQDATGIKWVIVGAETGNRKGKVGPQRAWVEHIAQTCKASGIPLFMKDSLRELMGDDFRQEFPWEDE